MMNDELWTMNERVPAVRDSSFIISRSYFGLVPTLRVGTLWRDALRR